MRGQVACCRVALCRRIAHVDALRPLPPIMPTASRGLSDVVCWRGFERIDRYESDAGAAVGKPREKIVSVEEMLRVAAAEDA